MRPAHTLVILLLLVLATTAVASDGVVEINQTCATQTGCLAGDDAGFPVTIDASGSYRLTSNLAVPNANTNGILVSGDFVSIDLAGFAIRGIVSCAGTPVVCYPGFGTGSGVTVAYPEVNGVSVRDGSVLGMGTYGVWLGNQGSVTNVRVSANPNFGIFVGDGSTVVGNTAYQNGFAGIVAGSGSTVSGNTVYRNGTYGISAAWGSTVVGNTIRSNDGYGLYLYDHSAYRENVISNNSVGSVLGAGFVNLGNNACDGTTNCP